MQIKNRFKIILIICSLYLLAYGSNIHADEFNISAKVITVDKANNIVIGTGLVEVTDNEGKLIKTDKVTYEKSKEFLILDGSVEIFDTDGNILTSDKATYDKPQNLITSYENSELLLNDGYKVSSEKIFYDDINKIMSSDKDSFFTDSDGNKASVSMFQFDSNKNLFSSIGKIKIIDANKNNYFFKELYVDTNTREMIGSDVSVLLDKENFGLEDKNDPRFVANDIFMTKNVTNLSKGIFTVCQKRGDDCPPWVLQAQKIKHDKIKKTIHYKHATLKVYGIPIFYFPRFSHPDPTVKRQSGFLVPSFANSSTVGTGFQLPYYWAISHDKDMTFTPKTYANENILLLNEYRQAFRNAFLTLDTSYTQGYKNTSATKTKGSRSHIFSELDIDLSEDSYESNLTFTLQKTSNDTYFRVHDIKTALVDSENTNLKNEINYNFSKDDLYLNVSGTVYEDLRKKTNSRYEYILPNVLFGKSFMTETFGTLDLESNAYYKNYDTNKHTRLLSNNIIWTPARKITANGFVNSIEGMVNNTNYNAKNTTDYKTRGTINELSSVLSLKTSLPLIKEGVNFSKIFTPNLMLRYAPGHMRSLSGDDVMLKYSNLYSMNKTSVIEDGLSSIIGLDYQINDNDSNSEKLSVSVGQVFNLEKNKDIPSSSSLDQKMSDVVGEINYNFSEIGKIDYKFSLDHNYNDLNYSEVSTNLNFGIVGFNLDYLEERNHIGNENYVKAGLSLNFNDRNKFNFETKKNFKTDSTELYNISYEYINDCLTAGLVFRREFYEDSDLDIEQKDSLMFMITFKPFGKVNTPFVNP